MQGHGPDESVRIHGSTVELKSVLFYGPRLNSMVIGIGFALFSGGISSKRP